MSRNWTDNQKKAIESHGRPILVSAAAGSGKTAVLTERILQMVTDTEHPVDIDRILVVTFTRAAAAEMRDRVRVNLENALVDALKQYGEQPSAEIKNKADRIQRQIKYLPNAMICTIDSFCMKVVKSYCLQLDMDPEFTMADEGRLKLISEQVLDEVLEEAYAQKDAQFLHMAESFSGTKGGRSLNDLVLDLYDQAQSHPWPDEWLKACEEGQDLWQQERLAMVRKMLTDCIQLSDFCLELVGQPDWPQTYADALDKDKKVWEGLLEKQNVTDMAAALAGFKHTALSRKKTTASDEHKNLIKSLRDELKDYFKRVQKLIITPALPEWASSGGDIAAALCRLTRQYSDRFTQEKRKKKFADFTDIEHFALQILLDHREDKTEPTAAADELAEFYHEVFIDEYQDSNLLQETLLTAIGRDHLFMVGDMKQSIYSFRMARPELFLARMNRYEKEPWLGENISLAENFRSSQEVVDSVNDVFMGLMTKSGCGIDYDKQRLNHARTDVPCQGAGTEILLCSQAEESEEDFSKAEGAMIAERIYSLTSPQTGLCFMDGTQEKLCDYSDIVILMRAGADRAAELEKTLRLYGIPARAQAETGFFDTPETRLLLDFLKVCDNPRQDYPLAAVLKSSLFNFNDEELAHIAAAQGEQFYDKIIRCSQCNDLLGRKCGEFLDKLADYREKAGYLPASKLLYYLKSQSLFFTVQGAMAQGQDRLARMELLLKKAEEFDAVNGGSLFGFIRYMEKLKSYDEDKAQGLEQGGGCVRIMTIHASKGLEFPVVFLANAQRQMLHRDSNSHCIIHPDFGAAADEIDTDNRVFIHSAKYCFIQELEKRASYDEEMRVLYVAMTRAREKLIVTAAKKNMESYAAKNSLTGLEKENIPECLIYSSESYLKWLLLTAADHVETTIMTDTDIYQRLAGHMNTLNQSAGEKQQELMRRIADTAGGKRGEHELYRKILDGLKEKYPYSGLADIYKKVSVSQLKAEAAGAAGEAVAVPADEGPGEFGFLMTAEADDGILLEETAAADPSNASGSDAAAAVVDPSVTDGVENISTEVNLATAGEDELPDFLKNADLNGSAGKPSAAKRGTDYHKFMQQLDFSLFDDEKALKAALAECPKRLSHAVMNLASSELGKHMRDAYKAGQLVRERNFTIGIPAHEVKQEWDSKELVVLQGICDVWWPEKDGIILVDYKSDRLPAQKDQAAQLLKERYETQLFWYARALTMCHGMQVKGRYIYSLYDGSWYKM